MLVTFPLCPVLAATEGAPASCGCGNLECERAGKHALVPAWTELTESVECPPGCGLAVLCGAVSRLVVVDLDRADADIPGELPETYTVRTARGLHLYYELPEGAIVRTRHLDGWDIQGEGAFVVGPGSIHRTGVKYEPVDPEAPMAPAPAWLLAFTPVTPRSAGAAIIRTPGRVPEVSELVELTEEIAAEPVAIEGEAGSTTTFNLLQKYLVVRHLDYPSIRPFLEAWNTRCEPPWEPEDWDRKVDEVLTKSRQLEGGATPGLLDRLAAASRGAAGAERASRKHTYTFGRTPRIAGAEDEDKPHPVSFEWVREELAHGSDWAGVFRCDEFYGGRVRAVDPIFPMTAEGTGGLSNEDVTLIRAWLERERRWVCKSLDVRDAIGAAARLAHSMNSARLFFEGLPAVEPGAIAELGSMLSPDPQAHDFLRKWLIGCVARVYRPGCVFQTMLVLCASDGGEKKSSFFAVLAGGNWYRSHLPDIHDPRKVGQALVGHLIVEFGELHAMRKADKEYVKEFLQRTHDKHDPKYRSEEVDAPRMCGFAGTSNDVEFLDRLDRATQRRYWPILVGTRIDTDRVGELRSAAWAEARDAFLAGEPWWYENERALDEYRDRFVASDTLDERLASYLTEHSGAGGLRSLDSLTASQIYMKISPRENGYPNSGDSKRMGAVLRSRGFLARKTHGKSVWLAPATFSAVREEEAA